MFAFRWKAGVTEKQKLRVAAEIAAYKEKIPGFSGNSRRREYSRVDKVRVWRRGEIRRQGLLYSYGPHPVHQNGELVDATH